jgi:hypothetical protein
MSWFLQRQRKELFLNKQNISEFFIMQLECELCVYGQGRAEIEMITQFSFGHN